MTDTLGLAAERVRAALYDMRASDFLGVVEAHEGGIGVNMKSATSAIAAAALAETGWRDIKYAPYSCPEHGGAAGYWYNDVWYETPMGHAMRFGSRADRGYTHYRLNPEPPPKPDAM